MHQEENREAVAKMTMQFLAEAIGQCPAGLESSTERDIVFAVLGFQYGAIQSAAYVAGLDADAIASVTRDVLGRINGMQGEMVTKILQVMPSLAKKEYPPIGIGGRAIIGFFNAAADEEKIAAACSLREILRQIDEA
ncbi:MAG: hypothetical protein HGA62_10585 [Chlorobiaceae bacterium]|nr:hypothetical protein [Chlorobiaceae bacterium]NTV61509.1 hypothetical protein [Chlorobiaceae bacterium]